MPENRALKDFAAVLMRKDPPFDMEYVYSTYLLEAAEREGARVFNRPRAIRDHNEKFAIARFGEFIAPTLVTRDAARIDAFIDAQGDTIVKPLDGMGGTSVFRVRADDPNRNVIVETVGQHGARTVMVQRFIPEITEGDKRVLLIAGEPVPFALARIPKEGETRGNLAAGGRGVARPLTLRDRQIAAALGPRALGRGPHRRRPRRDRRLPHRSQRHEPDVLRRDLAAVGLRRRRDVRRGARKSVRLRHLEARATIILGHQGVEPAGLRSRRRRDGATTGSTMIGILIIAHDSFAEGLARAVTHVLGSRPPQFEVLSVAATDDPHALLPAARELVAQLDTGHGVMIFSDIFGATPCNLAGKLLRPGRVEGIAGVNLPMLVRAFTYRTATSTRW